jgi:ApbE superfamily uncharacterized protein (UPF0280 family)
MRDTSRVRLPLSGSVDIRISTPAVTELFDNRTYRVGIPDGELLSFTVTVKETNLYIRANNPDTHRVRDAILAARHSLENYIRNNPKFAETLEPIPDDPLAPPFIRGMIRDARTCVVGPMAAVAGTLAEIAARSLETACGEDGRPGEVIVENGGDVYMISHTSRIVSLEWGGDGGASGRMGMEIPPSPDGIGISSSSGAFGHSLSRGSCDLATVVATGGSLSDAGATALGNRVKGPEDIEGAMEGIFQIPGVMGVCVVVGGKIGIRGDIRLVAVGRE